MKISILHPSRGRPEQALVTRNKWIANLDYSSDGLEYILVCDYSDPELQKYYNLFQLDGVHVGHHNSAIEAINTGAKMSRGDLIITISDDFSCCMHWDTLLLQALKGKSDFCAKINDGSQKWIITLPIMDRVYYNRFQYVYFPDYRHMFADTHMTSVAWMLGKYIELPLTFRHDHYTTGRTKRDVINIKNDQTWAQGEELFKKQRRMNFGLRPDEIVNKELPEISGLNTPRYR